ncbi:hypothetical protein NC796_07600 [Aliifodinibius sp. S!AR15-10]|uniref:hypothetical protein n=1 Tax=Aliifodinibius sp. S!AR15-10 TaxID=2950437 RepID=UPI0028632B70|nr:hypothetical protein [Aliifodinibius sp. S!AR15-10]MDR8390996.1 hypothetical protein [Aliifodinibius sp. S!AR15-10]
MGDINVDIDQKEFDEALDLLSDMHDSIDNKWLKSTGRRKTKPIIQKMQNNSPSSRLKEMIGVTTAKTKTPFLKVGVVKNDVSLFPNISSYGLAGILEYGTVERFRTATRFGLVTGKIPTGKVPARKYAFLRSSWDSGVKKFEADFIASIIKKIEKEMK